MTAQIQVPRSITMSPGEQVVAGTTLAAVPAALATDGLERDRIDPEYGAREGYDPAFVGVAVPLSVLNDNRWTG